MPSFFALRFAPLFLVLCLSPGRALAGAQLLVGATGGLSEREGARGPEFGPFAGVRLVSGFTRHWAADLGYRWDWLRVADGWQNRMGGSAQAQFRLDITPAVPFADLGIYGLRVESATRPTYDAGLALALGLLAPLGERWFAGVRLEYAFSAFTDALPSGRLLELSAGYRLGDF